jgi:hypothetical protein
MRKSSLSDLLLKRATLAQINRVVGISAKEPMPPDVMGWFGLIGITLAKAWNAGRYTISDEELFRTVITDRSKSTTPDNWSRAIGTLSSRDPTQPMHFLLKTDASDEFLINHAGLQDFWQSGQIQAFLWIHGGEPSSLRQPSTEQEEEWCAWLRSLEDESRALGS